MKTPSSAGLCVWVKSQALLQQSEKNIDFSPGPSGVVLNQLRFRPFLAALGLVLCVFVPSSASAAPQVTTLVATGVAVTNATLNGEVIPGSLETRAWFEYGTTTNYGNRTATNTLAPSLIANAVSNLIAVVLPGTTYHFRLVATNSDGIALGADRILGNGAPHTFSGADPGLGLDLQGSFVYALNIGNSNLAPGLVVDANFTAETVPGVSITTLSNPLGTINNWNVYSTLSPPSIDNQRLFQAMQSIHWAQAPDRLKVQLSGLQIGNSYQLQLIFIEEGNYNRVFDVKADGITLIPNFRLQDYGPPAITPVVIPYLFTAANTNMLIELGGGYGGADTNPILSALTLEVLRPAVTTLTATGVTATNATLNAQVNPDNLTTKVWFQYGVTTNYGSCSATNTLIPASTTLAVSNLITGLTPGSMYHFRVVATNSGGIAVGADKIFGDGVPHTFSGPEPGLGLDLQGNFIYAVNVGTNGAPGFIGDANFTAETVSGVTVTTRSNALGTINNWVTNNFGATPDDIHLNQAMDSIHWAQGPDYLQVYLAGLQTGTSYQLQLMFIEQGYNRVFDVNFNGATLTSNFRLTDYGPYLTPIVIPHVFTATNSTALIELGGGVGAGFHDPILSAFTLEALAPVVATPVPFQLVGTSSISGGAFQLSFTNLSGLGFTVLGSTNLALPLSGWTVLGSPVETPPGSGNYQFTDSQATNLVSRFYQVRSP